MILTAIMDIIYNIIDAVFVFTLPSLPDSLITVANEILNYILTGLDIIRAFVGDTAMTVFGVCLVLVVAMNGLYLVYSIVFWVIRKLPVLNVRE